MEFGREEAATGGRYTVLVVDDHELFVNVLSMAFCAHWIDSHQLVPASIEDILRTANSLPRGLVVLDLDLGFSAVGDPMHGGDAVAALRGIGWSVLVVTESPGAPEVAAAVSAGAAGVLPKTASFSVLLATVGRLAAGEPVMTDLERDTWLARDRENRTRMELRTRLLDQLTHREGEVLELLAQGHRAAAIAEHFVVSIGTVRAQIKSIRAKLNVTSQLEAAALLRVATVGPARVSTTPGSSKQKAITNR